MNEKRYKFLTESLNDCIEKMQDMTAKAVTDTGEERAFTEDEQKEFDALEARAKALKNTIEAEERARDLELKPTEPEKKQEETAMNEEQRALAEERAFVDYIRGVVSEERGTDVNLTRTDGQVTIPTTIANKIITKVYDMCPIARMATRYNVKGTLNIPYYPAAVTSGGATTYPDITMAYASEFVELESTAGKFSSITLQGFLAGVLTKVSKSLINNSQFDILGFVVDHMAENIARWIEYQCLIGDHANSRIDGLSQLTQTMESGTASAVTADELIDLQGMIKDAFQAKACWIMSPATRQEIRKLKDGEDRYLLIPDFSVSPGGMLLGKPVYVSDNMPGLGAGNKEIFYGDFSGLALKISESLNVEVLRERFATEHVVGVVGWLECDAKIENEQKICALVGKS